VTLAFLAAAVVWGVIHEGIHILVAMFYGEFARVAVVDFLPQVVYETPVDARGSELKWTLIAGLPSIVTVLLGYGMLAARNRIQSAFSGLKVAVLYWTTVVLLLLDPANLALGPFIFGGDAIGVAWGLDVPVIVVQGVAGLVLLVNREVIVRMLFPLYDVETDNPIWQPL
jgi:hypothetical protein